VQECGCDRILPRKLSHDFVATMSLGRGVLRFKILTFVWTVQRSRPHQAVHACSPRLNSITATQPRVGSQWRTGTPDRTPCSVGIIPRASTPNAVLTFGNAGRNIVTGPGFRNFDFSVLKNTHLRENVNLQFRAEFFNITNHPNFALPSNILAAPNFGALFQTPDAAQNSVGLGSGGPRLIQLAVKLSF
jgi:hypothetical protein